MDRRSFVTGAGAAALATSLRGAALPGVKPAPRNVVFIIAEQLQYNVCSFAGGPAQTPNLEKLTAVATNFASACTTTALCSPARSCMFTGRWGHRTGLDDNCVMWHSRLNELDLSHTTLIDWAHRKGDWIGYYGKWHLGSDGPILRGADGYPANGIERAWQQLDGKSQPKPDFAITKPYYDTSRKFDEKPVFFATAPGGYEQTGGAKTAIEAIDFLQKRPKEKPFFLTVSFQEVHPAYVVPAPYNHMYDPAKVTLPTNLKDTFAGKPQYQNDVMWPFHDTAQMSEEDWRKAIAYYYGDITLLDRAVGQVLDAIRSQGAWDDTLIIFTSDHGDMTGAHNRFDKGPYCYDEVLRVPLLVRMPGAPARRIERQVSTIDIAATVVDWLSLTPDQPPVDSRSLLSLCQHGESGRMGPDEIFYRYEWYNGLWFGIRAIRTPEYIYAFNPGGPDELYDLRNDPAEMQNQIHSAALESTCTELRHRLLAYLQSIEDPGAVHLEKFLKQLV